VSGFTIEQESFAMSSENAIAENYLGYAAPPS
jgi:hypothetical protein